MIDVVQRAGMRKLIGLLALALLAGCGQTYSSVSVTCPAGSQCDPSVQAPTMPPQQIYYYSQNPAAAQQAGITTAVLEALIVQDMMWRSCWDCYGPTYYSRFGYYSSYSPAQRTTVIQQNTTIINNNKTVINKVAASPPAAARSVAAPNAGSSPKTTSPASPAAAPKTTSPTQGTNAGGGSNFKPAAPATKSK
jgi:hypothetical protein